MLRRISMNTISKPWFVHYLPPRLIFSPFQPIIITRSERRFCRCDPQKVQVQPPTDGVCLRKTALTAWVIRVWETHPPQGQEALEWILLTTLPITFPCDAWEVVQWYGWRWRNGRFPQGAQDRLPHRRALFANRR